MTRGEATRGFFVLEDADMITHPVINSCAVLQTKTVNGRQAGTIYVYTGNDVWIAAVSLGGGVASGIAVTPFGSIAATNVQAALEEIVAEAVASAGLFSYQVENLVAGEDIGDGTAANARTIFIAPTGLTISKISILSQGIPAGIDNSNTLVIKVYRGTSLIVSKTYNTGTPFPADHAEGDLGTLANNTFTTGQDLRFDVVCGATANPPSFVLQVAYA